MPIPKTKDVGKTLSFLKTEKPGMPKKQKIAIALDTARRIPGALRLSLDDFVELYDQGAAAAAEK